MEEPNWDTGNNKRTQPDRDPLVNQAKELAIKKHCRRLAILADGSRHKYGYVMQDPYGVKFIFVVRMTAPFQSQYVSTQTRALEKALKQKIPLVMYVHVGNSKYKPGYYVFDVKLLSMLLDGLKRENLRAPDHGKKEVLMTNFELGFGSYWDNRRLLDVWNDIRPKRQVKFGLENY